MSCIIPSTRKSSLKITSSWQLFMLEIFLCKETIENKANTMMRGKSPPSDVEMYHVADRKLQVIPLFNYFFAVTLTSLH